MNRHELRNIFAVDDNINTLKGISKYFEQFNNTIHLDTYHDPIVALEAFKNKLNTSESYELAILDWSMPRLTGEILSVILKEYNPKIKTVLFTGSDHDIFLNHMDCYKIDNIYKKRSGIKILESVMYILGIK